MARIEPREVIDLVESYIGNERHQSEKYENRSLLDDSGCWSLHELAAQGHHGPVRYEITEQGPEHDKTFRAVVYLNEEPFGAGSGRSKKLAEQAAAEEAWLRLAARSGMEPAREETDG